MVDVGWVTGNGRKTGSTGSRKYRLREGGGDVNKMKLGGREWGR